MKKHNILLTALCFTFLLFSCGSDDIGEDTIGQTFQLDPFDFIDLDGNNTDTATFTVPDDIVIFDSDVALVFVLDQLATNNESVNVFEPLPNIFFFDFANGGTTQYRSRFIFDSEENIFDVDITLMSDNFSGLANRFTNNQIFRIVIVPSEFASAPENQNLTFNEVRSKLNLEL